MPNKPAAMKARRQTKKRTLVNRAVARELKSALKKTRQAAETKSAAAEQMLHRTVQLLDKAVRKRVLKKNAAARAKSRLMKLWRDQKTS